MKISDEEDQEEEEVKKKEKKKKKKEEEEEEEEETRITHTLSLSLDGDQDFFLSDDTGFRNLVFSVQLYTEGPPMRQNRKKTTHKLPHFYLHDLNCEACEHLAQKMKFAEWHLLMLF